VAECATVQVSACVDQFPRLAERVSEELESHAQGMSLLDWVENDFGLRKVAGRPRRQAGDYFSKAGVGTTLPGGGKAEYSFQVHPVFTLACSVSRIKPRALK
jgi:hypothetical protein